jgi:hypothetical protein
VVLVVSGQVEFVRCLAGEGGFGWLGRGRLRREGAEIGRGHGAWEVELERGSTVW